MNEPPIPPPPPHIAELAAACVEFVRRSIDAALDGTPDTLPLLDAWLKQSRGELRPEVVQLIAPAAGAYFGEVLRRAFPARWHAPPDSYASWRLELEDCFLYFNPIGVAVEAMQHEDTEGLGAAFTVAEDLAAELRRHLEIAAPVRVDDYYLLTTRFEVIDQIVHFLMVRRASSGPSDTSAEAYETHASRDAPADA